MVADVKKQAYETDDEQPEIEMITYEVKPYVSGIRVVSLPNENGFISYTEAGVSLIYPDTKVRIVIFGYHLDKIGVISLTTDNCFNSLLNVTHPEFLIQTVKRLDFLAYFAEWAKLFQFYFNDIDETRTWISTETPARIYYLPLYLQMSIVFVLFCLSALFSGLNLGLMALSPQELMLIQKSGSRTERQYAETILPVRQSGNYLLCTILIMNVVVNAAISILFEDMTSGVLAFIIASVGIVVIGEIIPQSICVKKGLAVGAYTIWLTRAFMILTFPLSYPISKILDIFLGEDTPVYDRNKLINLMKMTTSEENQELAADLKIAVGAMEISEKTVGDILTKIEDVFMLPETIVLDATNIAEIIRRGYTRIPVCREDNRNDIISLLMVKDLALIDPGDNFTVKMVCQFNKHPLRFVDESTPLHTMLDEFKAGDYHLAIVQTLTSKYDPKTGKQYKEPIGIITLEDIVEEILQAEIVDESDTVTDNVYRNTRKYNKEPNVTRILMFEEKCKTLSVQMESMAIHWLKNHHALFTNDYVDERALSCLMRKNIRQMEFEAGPWTCFGTELLDQLDELVNGNPIDEDQPTLSGTQTALIGSIQFTPDFDVQVSEFCRFFQLTVPGYLNAYQVTKIARTARAQRAVMMVAEAEKCSSKNGDV
ncbi:Metal transporter CNNM4 [Toxocara canis]|uniref:Metal transporter CNNM4 n=1 Tax=Toxocara canis TaxID=6265 RepID=A0A0B2UWM3_TOXCA|nr:Metal transporter CNNM4 [Toxocara canis]